MGVAESTFPHPKQWRIPGIDKDLDMVTVRDLTREWARRSSKPPTCIGKWEERLGELPWASIGQRYTAGLCSPKCFGSHYKCVLHRALLCAPHNDELPNDKCRFCQAHRESLVHLGSCPALRPVYQALRLLDGGSRWDDVPLNLLGVTGQHTVRGAVSAAHFHVWKFVILMLRDMTERVIPNPTASILRSASERLENKIAAVRHRLVRYRRRCELRRLQPCYDTYNRWLEGAAEIDEDGEVSVTPQYAKWVAATQPWTSG